MREILDDVLTLLDAGEAFALVKLAGDRGSTPRAAGAEMLVRRDGSIAGTIGGGLLELTMVREAAGVLRARRPRLVDLRLAGTDLASDEEMVCGGSAEVLIAYVPPGDPALREVLAARRPPVRPAAAPGSSPCCRPRTEATWSTASSTTTASSPERGRASRRRCARPSARSPCTAARPCRTADACSSSSWRRRPPRSSAAAVTWAAPWCRSRWAPASPSPCSTTARSSPTPAASPAPGPCSAPSAARSNASASTKTAYVVIVTRGHTHDMDVLQQALRTPARYVGLMASRSKRARMVAALEEAGLGDQVARVYSPIGLDIGAETPAELAVSIVAEMIQVRAGKSA